MWLLHDNHCSTTVTTQEHIEIYLEDILIESDVGDVVRTMIFHRFTIKCSSKFLLPKKYNKIISFTIGHTVTENHSNQ
jgi:hypothetical protein